MSKRKKQRNARRRPPKPRNAASGGLRARARASVERLAQRDALQTAAIAVGGGALGALAAGVAVGAGVQPKTAAVVTLAGGAAGAYFLRGKARVAALGAACAASGQLALAWEIQHRAEKLRATSTTPAQAPSPIAGPAPPVPMALLPAPLPAASTAPSAPRTEAKRQGLGRDDEGEEPDGWRNAWAVEPWAAFDDDDEEDDEDDEDGQPVLYVDNVIELA